MASDPSAQGIENLDDMKCGVCRNFIHYEVDEDGNLVPLEDDSMQDFFQTKTVSKNSN